MADDDALRRWFQSVDLDGSNSINVSELEVCTLPTFLAESRGVSCVSLTKSYWLAEGAGCRQFEVPDSGCCSDDQVAVPPLLASIL